MPHHYHLKIQSAIFWITFLGIALLAQQPANKYVKGKKVLYMTQSQSELNQASDV